MLANREFLVAGFVQLYGTPIGAAMATMAIVWQVRSGGGGMKTEIKDIKSDIADIKGDIFRLKHAFSTIEGNLHQVNKNILVVTKEATLAMQINDYKRMNVLAAQILCCQESGGKGC